MGKICLVSKLVFQPGKWEAGAGETSALLMSLSFFNFQSGRIPSCSSAESRG